MIITEDIVQQIEKWDRSSTYFKGDKIGKFAGNDVFGYFDERDLLHILIKSNKHDFNDIEREGISVSYKREFFAEQGETGVIDFTCNSNRFIDFFIKIINEILNNLETYNNVESKILRVIDSWFLFLSLPKIDILTDKQIVGLIGELLLFEKFCKLGVSTELIINSWVGPAGGKKDFTFNKFDIEVKTSSSQRGHVHHVGSLEQLSLVDNKSLYVYSWNIYKDFSDSSFNLPIVINRIKDNYINDLYQMQKFDAILYDAGFDLRESHRYIDYKYVVKSDFLCIVDENFPNLTKDILGNFNSRILKIAYEIDLNGIEKSKIEGLVDEI